jgi:hypothetical protein
MSDYHFIAVVTFGTEIHGDQSHFKFGQGSGADVLLTLFGNRAREFVLPRASYRYVHVDMKNLRTHRNYLVLRVTPEEKAHVEAVCHRRGSSTWVYLWEAEDRRWLEFPCHPLAHYSDPSSYGGSCPKFPPTHTAFFTVSQNSVEAKSPIAASGVTLKQSGDWWWIAGDTYAHRETLKMAGAHWSKSRREWYYKGRDLPQVIRALAAPLESVPSAASAPVAEVSAEMVIPSELPATTAPAEPQKPDNIAFAIKRMKSAEPVITSPRQSASRQGMVNIAQEYVGELTGSITGTVHCFGYAVDQGICVYVNFGGPRMAVEAIRAKLGKGDIVNCSSYDAPSVELTPGEGKSGRYTAFMQNIPEARYTSVILLHECITAPNYGGKSRTCILRTDEAQGVAMLKQHITRLVAVPVFDAWAGYLWDAGALACLISRPVRAGGVDLWSVELDADAWTQLICGGLREGVIQFPQST